MSDELLAPDWAIERAISLAERSGATGYALGFVKAFPSLHPATIAFARYIAEHEEVPVDPLLIEARAIAAADPVWSSSETAQDIISGMNDDYSQVRVALAALRRGMELATQPTDQVQP